MPRQQIGRLAMRHEGEWWNAYYALTDTMEGALLLGSIRITMVADPKRKNAFMGLMRDAVGDMFKRSIGTEPDWGGAHSAPEHERSGTA
jgi:hypothetical protein